MVKIPISVFASLQLEREIIDSLRAASDIELTVAFTSRADFTQSLIQQKPKIALLEELHETSDMVDLVGYIRLHHSATKCIILAKHLDIIEVRRAVAAGIGGYLLVPTHLNSLLAAIRLVHAGNLALAPEIVRLLGFGK